jgi:UDP-2,3-diacylglucosamine pyrophosphatase LpxH
MRHLVHVISDLHLGGAAATATEPAFQMCPPSTHQVLADFLDNLPASDAEQESHLVVAGEIVDILAEAPFEPFTADPAAACQKLQRIFDSTAVVWEALDRFAGERGGFITLMLGNHDIELALPAVRTMLGARLQGPRLRFIYDNEAFTLGPILIEHGNRFDPWNAVPHGSLRRVRSQMSRNAAVSPAFVAPPGSRMVIDVINPLKRKYPFIDLLKPESAVCLPIAAALGAVDLQKSWNAFRHFEAQLAVDFDEDSGAPADPDYVAAAADPDLEMWHIAQAVAGGDDSGQVGAMADLLGKGATIVTEKMRAARIDALYRAFRKLAALRRMNDAAFKVDVENATYLKPARLAAAHFKVIVYGHTHLPKRVPLNGAVYLNTGTWADMMCIPDGIWDADETAGRAAFRAFAADLGAGSLERWRRSMPTYARIVVDDNALAGADVYFADDHSPVSTDGILGRLQA